MIDHKIFDVFKSFDAKKMRRFEDFIQSPYPKKSPTAVNLGLYLINFYPDFDAALMDEVEAFNAIQPDKAYTKHELIRYLSLLLATTEDFIVFEYVEETRFVKEYLLTQYYYETRNYTGLKKTIKKNEKKLVSEALPDNNNYFYSFLNKKASFNYCWQLKNVEEAQSHVKESAHYLNNYFIIQLLQASISFYQCHKRKPEKEEVLFLDTVLEEVEANIERMPPLVILWYLASSLTLNPMDVGMYAELKEALLRHIRDIPTSDAHTFTVILNNTLIKQLGSDRKQYIAERYDLYQIEIKEGWLVVNGVIGYQVFNNIIMVSLILNKRDAAEAFLDEYQEYLPSEIHGDVVNYNKARIAFSKGDYHECLQLVQQVQYLNHSFTLGIKRIQMMCYIELDDYAQVQHVWNSMTVYIYRMDANYQSLKDRNMHFAKVIKLQIKEDWLNKSEKYERQIREITKSSPLMPEMEWVDARLGRAC